MKYSTYLWDLDQPLSQHPLPCAWHQPNLMIPLTKTINKKKRTKKRTKNQEMRLYSQKIVSYCLGLRTQNPGLKEADLGPSI